MSDLSKVRKLLFEIEELADTSGANRIRPLAQEALSSLSAIEAGTPAALDPATVERCAKLVPTNWLDPLLTGEGAPGLPLDERGVEILLRGIQGRIRSLTSTQAEGGATNSEEAFAEFVKAFEQFKAANATAVKKLADELIPLEEALGTPAPSPAGVLDGWQINIGEIERIGGREKNPDIDAALRILELNGLLSGTAPPSEVKP